MDGAVNRSKTSTSVGSQLLCWQIVEQRISDAFRFSVTREQAIEQFRLGERLIYRLERPSLPNGCMLECRLHALSYEQTTTFWPKPCRSNLTLCA